MYSYGMTTRVSHSKTLTSGSRRKQLATGSAIKTRIPDNGRFLALEGTALGRTNNQLSTNELEKFGGMSSLEYLIIADVLLDAASMIVAPKIKVDTGVRQPLVHFFEELTTQFMFLKQATEI